jgi:AbrB family looped-hinge helix DNA binding protein
MEASVDKFGRVVIPKRLRERLSLEPGTRVRFEADGDGVKIVAAEAAGGLENRGGRLVHTGRLRADADVDGLLERLREERAAGHGSGRQ